jgi:hypothetical protein
MLTKLKKSILHPKIIIETFSDVETSTKFKVITANFLYDLWALVLVEKLPVIQNELIPK